MDDPQDGPGSPFDELFKALGAGGGQAGKPPDLSGLFAQLQRMLTPYEGSVNWGLAHDIARQTVAQSPDPSPSNADQAAVTAAVQLAEIWLDAACNLPAGAAGAAAWSRAEWVEATMPVWQQLVEPVAAQVVEAMQHSIPAEAKSMAGPLVGMLSQAGGAMFGAQVGQAVGGLAAEVVSSGDVGLPLSSEGKAAIVVANARAFGAGLGLEESDVFLYLALRECAVQRLFAHVPWLRGHLVGAVEEYARGITIDMSAIEGTLSGIDPTNLESLQDALSGGLFEPEQTPAQQAALRRLETALALVDGWVDEVVTQATAERMPAAPQLQEAVRRRRAAGGPAEQTFASLVGLELRPRRLRDAAALWGALRSARGDVARDQVWTHPDLLPGPEDLDDPLGFAQKAPATVVDSESADFDAALADLLDAETDSGDTEGEGEPKPS